MQRRSFFKVAGLSAAAAVVNAPTQAASRSVTFLVAHGAWSAGWAWKKMHPLMIQAGHRLATPTYTGLGERFHLSNKSVDLEMHIQDMLAVVKYEDLHDFVLIGHSYGGMVATGVADRIPERIAKIIYVDAFVPKDGQSLLDLTPPETKKRMLESIKSGDGWRVSPNPVPNDTSPDDKKWIEERRNPQPVKCFDMPLHLKNGDTKLPRAYIRCTRIGAEDVFAPFAERAKRELWTYREVDASHSAHVTAADALAALLTSIAG